MRRFVGSMLFLVLLGGATSLRAESFDPDMKRLIREAHKPKVNYGPARVGWNGPEVPATPVVNATYESLRVDSPAALRQELRSVLVPQWQVLLAFLVMIAGLRMLRDSRSDVDEEIVPTNVVPFPTALPQNEAEAA